MMIIYANCLEVIKRSSPQSWQLLRPALFLSLLIFFQVVFSKAEVIRVSPTSTPGLRKIEAGETHSYSIEIKANQVIRFKFEKEDLRLNFEVFDPANKQVFQAFYRRYGTVRPWFISKDKGIYHFKITSLEKNLIGFNYKFEISAQREFREKDLILFGSEEKFREAEELRRQWGSIYLERSLKLYDEAATIWRLEKEWRSLTNAFEQIGEVNLIFGNYEKSLDAYHQALAFSRRTGDKTLELRQSCKIGEIYSLLGQFEKAKQKLTYVKKRAEMLKLEGPLVAQLYNNLGEIFHDEGNLEKGRQYFEKALKISESLQNRLGEALSYRHLGYANIDAGLITTATQNFAQAFSLCQELEDLRCGAYIQTGQAHLQFLRLESELAHNLHLDAQQTFEYIGDRQGVAVTSHGIGNIYEFLNHPPHAIESYSRAFQINRELQNQSHLATTGFALARAYRLNKDYPEADKYFQQSLELSRQTKKKRLEEYILNTLAGFNLALGNEAEALKRYQQTISFYRKVGDIRGEALILGEIGNLYQEQGNLSLSEKTYQTALSLNQRIGDNLAIAGLKYHLAELEFKRGNFAPALSLLDESISITETMRKKLRNPTIRAAYQATSQKKIELFIDILMRIHQNDSQSQWVTTTLEKVEEWRGRMLLELLNETRIEPRFEVDENLLKQEKDIQNKLALKIEKDTSLRLLSGAAVELKKIEQEINNLNKEYDDLQVQIWRAVDPKYEAIIKNPPFASLPDIQSTLEKEKDTVYLSYFLGSRNSYVWLVEKTQIKVFALDKKEILEDSAREVYRLLTARQHQKDETEAQLQERVRTADKLLCQQTEKLSRQLLGQVAPYITGKRLLISLDGALQYVPFEALPAPDPNTSITSVCHQTEQPSKYKLILETNEVVYVPSFSILKSLRQSRSEENDSVPGDTLGIWADPVYESDDPVWKEKNIQVKQSPESAEFQEELVPLPLRRLVKTKQESLAVAGLWPTDKVKLFPRLEANLGRLLDNPAQYRFLHIAAHGLFNKSRPENSGILLSRFNEKGEPNRSFLSLKDIFRLRLHADLVVLSACQSGLGEDLPGEGLTGLKHGFFYAGAKSEILSLWQVQDDSTSILMYEFYRALLEDQLPVPTALQRAKLKVYQQPGTESPFYWAAFTLHGDYSIPNPARKSPFSNSSIIIFIIFFLSLVIFFCFFHIKNRRSGFTNSKAE